MREKDAVFNCRGLVLRTTDVGDHDRMLTVLSAEEGKLSVWARGVRKINSGALSSAQLFAYSNFTLRRGRDRCFLRESNILETFLGISADIGRAALATYFCEIADEVSYPGASCADLLQLTLNALWALAKTRYPVFCIKGAYELRAAAIAGFRPDLFSCCSCGAETVGAYGALDCENGRLFCADCHHILYVTPKESLSREAQLQPDIDTLGVPIVWQKVTPDALRAMRYILASDPKRQFSFVVPAEEQLCFNIACEGYLLHHIGHGYKTLSFYKTVEGL